MIVWGYVYRQLVNTVDALIVDLCRMTCMVKNIPTPFSHISGIVAWDILDLPNKNQNAILFMYRKEHKLPHSLENWHFSACLCTLKYNGFSALLHLFHVISLYKLQPTSWLRNGKANPTHFSPVFHLPPQGTVYVQKSEDLYDWPNSAIDGHRSHWRLIYLWKAENRIWAIWYDFLLGTLR